MEELEQRLEAIEQALGLNEHPDARPKDVDVLAVRKALIDRGFNRVFTIPKEKLRRLHEVTHKTDMRPLGEKLNSIEFCSELIEQRAEMLKQFEDMVQVVLNSEPIAAVGQHEIALQQVTLEIEDSIRLWKEWNQELESFRGDLSSLLTSLHGSVAQLERKVAEKTKK